ncbi:MAG TPA: heme-degrading domain-containing protein [Bacillota bacterium]|nr:heme-degrading domain-containing protein [Bacillota bacterium]
MAQFTIESCIAEEAELQFPAFLNSDALKLGLFILRRAQKESKKIAIDIERHGQQLFHYAMEGTTPDNDQWIIRKKNVVKRFHKSSMHVRCILQEAGMDIESKYFLSPREYSAHGGSFPLIIKGVGVVGTITVSGLPQEEDHALVVSCLREFLQTAEVPHSIVD